MSKSLFWLSFISALMGGVDGAAGASRPDLVIVISIDQFRYDYLERFERHFEEGGFRRFLEKGANFINAHFRHSSTKTGPGHAVILTGAHANSNGIITNTWLDRETLEPVYCVQDDGAILLNLDGSKGRSPRLLLGSTVGDSLKISTGYRAKVISVSTKDRAAVLMGGKMADAAYWRVNGQFVTSDYYTYKLPKWVEDFNQARPVDEYFGRVWDRILPEATYAIQASDDFQGEFDGVGLGRTLPKRIDGGLNEVGPSFYSAFTSSPFSLEVLSRFVKEAIVREKLGKRDVTDLLCVGYSAIDRIGHNFGPGSHEIMDAVVRIDRILANLFSFVEDTLGLDRCLLVITSDHGVAPIPERILVRNDRLEAGRVETSEMSSVAKSALDDSFGPLPGEDQWLVVHFENVYLNRAAIAKKGVEVSDVERVVKKALEKMRGIRTAYTRTQLARGWVSNDEGRKALLSFHEKRSGDFFVQLEPYFILNFRANGTAGTDHGTPYSYDSHVPLLWYGKGVPIGRFSRPASVVDIAPTLCAMLGVTPPDLSEGKPLF